MAGKSANLLEFENQIFLDFFNENGLLVLCEGLGLERIFLHFLHLYCDVKELVFVLNTDQMQQQYYIEKLKAQGIAQLPRSVTSEYSANDRKRMYAEGGVFFASSQILVMDLLVDRIPVHLISGILVNKAHKMADACQEPFIMRLFRQKNKDGFIKAFTDNPVALVGGYSRLEKVMKNLFTAKVFLWPRFHSSVLDCFDKHKPEVIEISALLTNSMRLIQTSLLEIVSACLRELKSNNPGIETDDFTLENSLGRSFDRSVRAQLDPVWNQLGSKTKHLVSDLRTLRLLLHALSQYDCVTFLKMLESSTATEKAFGKNPGWIFLDASDSLFTHARSRVHGNKSKTEGKSSDASSPLLEESPKWKILKEVLGEIVEANNATADTELGKGKVLICASDMRGIYILKDFLKCGSRFTLLRLYNKTFNKNIPQPVSEDAASLFVATSDVQGGVTEANLSSDENKYSMLKVLDMPETHLHALRGNPDPYSLTRALEEIQPRYVILYDSSVHFVRQLEIYKACRPGVPLRVYFLTFQSSAEEQIYLTSLRREKEAFHTLIHEKSLMVVPKEREGKGKDDLNLQRSVEPAYEVNTNTRKAGGQSNAEESKTQIVVVDMREFRSELPSLLHKRGIDIEPITLEVGDYILTSDICVERKSLSDLIGSLNSGRLYTQCVAMSRHYKQPMLLIEFDANKAFSFQARGITGASFSLKDLNQKLALLLLHFPQLRIAWCSSPAVSAQLFHELKVARNQPDATRAALIGVEASDNQKSSEQTYNSAPYDFLLKLPGINTKNCRRILHHVRDLEELCQLSEAQLATLLDSKVNAEQLHTFLHKNYDKKSAAESTGSSEKPSGQKFKRNFSGGSKTKKPFTKFSKR